MNTCDTCRFWTLDKSDVTGDCSSPKWQRGYGIATTAIMPDGVLVENDEGWGFTTAPKFGCIHWTQHPPQGDKP
jgi:hypothetical protein